MSKVLYPKPKAPKAKRITKQKDDLSHRPYHVQYTDPTGELDPEWGHYNSELEVKTAAWYNCKLLGFRPNAVLFERDELRNG